MADKRYLKVLQDFGIEDAYVKEIGAYDDANYIVSSDNSRYILKEYNESEGLAERQNAGSCRIFMPAIRICSSVH
jgi:hypothetical protein